MSTIRLILSKYLNRFPDEAERLASLLSLVNTADEAQVRSRENFQGHITASGFLISASRRLVLRVHHRKLNRLLQPGGHIEPTDRSPLATAIREIAEETSIRSLNHIAFHSDVQVPIDIDTHEIPEWNGQPPHLHHDFRYLFICKDEHEFRLNEDEFDSHEWGPIAALMQETTFQRLKPKIERALSNEFRSKLFFDGMIERTVPECECGSIVVAHTSADSKVFLRALHENAPIQAVMPKPRSRDEKVEAELRTTFPILPLGRKELEASPSKISEILNHAHTPCVLLDIGG